jgi:hypothetical protein
MSLTEVLRRVTDALDQAAIPYMLTGSFASAYYGSPRSTQDVDFVLAATAPQLQAFVATLPSDEYYAEIEAALEAHKRGSMFNVIDLKTGWKIDMIIRKSRPFSQEEFRRRQRVSLQGISLFVASAEDVIIAKLEWAKLAQSLRHIEDVAGILKIKGNSLDRPYLDKWIRELQLVEQWNQAQQMAGVSLGHPS